MNYAYARVSTKEQNLDRQIDEFKNYNIDRIYCDKQSGKDFERVEYKKLLKRLKENDTLYIMSIDRLGRDYDLIIENWKLITQKKHANIVVLDMPILNTQSGVNGLDGKFLSNLVLQILSYVAQKEREKIKERQMQGIRSAQERGVKFGRPKKRFTREQLEIIKDYLNDNLDSATAIKNIGISKATFFRVIKRATTKRQNIL